MKKAIYAFLVNRHEGIRERYHRIHDGSTGAKTVLSWVYLLWMNFAYYVLFCRFLGKRPAAQLYESKRLPTRQSESEQEARKNPGLSVEAFTEKLMAYDVVSFDIFDTLILRPLSQPTDVFWFIGERLGIMDFRNIRIQAEQNARGICWEKNGHTEIALRDIWEKLAEDVGCDAEEGMRVEQETELSLCYANPFMLDIWRRLCDAGTRIVVVSDMYLSHDFLCKLLEKNGFTGAEKVYVSNEYHKNKASGTLLRLVKKELGAVSVIHVGDNPHSDDVMAKKYGFDTLPYPNINRNMLLYRPFDMSYMVGSAYRAIVSAHLYCGTETCSMEYEYGYLYGGLFVLGYCGFVHDYVERNGVDKLLFLSRDGDILKQVYDRLYPGEDTAYVYWSRKAATKLMADEDRHDYFRRFVFHKVNQGYTLRLILRAMELEHLAEELGDWKEIYRTHGKQSESERFVDLRPDDELTGKNAVYLRRFLEAKWDEVLAAYEEQCIAAERYYREILDGSSNAAAVDIGWAGSGALALSHLAEKVWRIPCRITGIVAGTNTVHNAEPDASEPFLQSGRLTAYLYSQSHNRDLLKKHDPNKDYNVFWELLLSSPTPQFSGFGLAEDGEIRLDFGKYDENLDGIREIQRGILDFVDQYRERFAAFDYMLHVSGRDAYAPMMVAASHKEKYLKAIEERFALKINVD